MLSSNGEVNAPLFTFPIRAWGVPDGRGSCLCFGKYWKRGEMTAVSTRADYKSELALDKPAPHRTVARPDDFVLIEEFLHLLARAVRQCHTYPPNSPLCTEAIAACHKAFASLDRRDRLVLRVTPTELIVDEVGVGAGTIVEQELVRRLHHARVIALDIDRIATRRHFLHFCLNVHRCDELASTKTTFAELLVEQGVDTIVPAMAHRPEVFDIGVPSAPLCDLVGHEQRRRQAAFAAGGPVDYLYPPDKGWVRLDPSTRLSHVSLIDLAVLVDDPAETAVILLRLTDDDPVGPEERKTALERKFSDVTTLFASLDPRLARIMFGKLARAVLELEPVRRKDLLRRTILPGLLDQRAAGAVLCDFPDVDLADALCLLLELETAAPEVLTAALNRLDLPADRRDTVIPLINARLRCDAGGDIPAERSKERELDRLASRLVRVDAAPGKDFSEFAAFDLSIDDQTASAIVAAREAIDATDLPCIQLAFLSNLVHLEPNPGVVDTFLRLVLARFAELERCERWQDLAAWGSQFRQLAARLREPRPDVADAISKALAAFYVPARVSALADLHARGTDARRVANALVEAFGVAVVPGLIALLDDTARQSRAPAVVSLMCEHAQLLAPALALHLGHGGVSTTRAIVKVLGFAGAGREVVISEQLGHADEQTSREVLRALARIGTTPAAALVARELQVGSVGRRAAAEEALWHFPAAPAAAQVRQLLGSRDFVVQHPDVAARLLTRAAHAGTDGLEKVLAEIEPLRFRFWNPGLVRVALKARELRMR
jgi:hypothetical protein